MVWIPSDGRETRAPAESQISYTDGINQFRNWQRIRCLWRDLFEYVSLSQFIPYEPTLS